MAYVDVMNHLEPCKITVKATHKVRGQVRDEEYSEDIQEWRRTMMNPAKASVFVSRTVNLGNYESLNVNVGVSLPCDPKLVEDTLDEGKSIVVGKLQAYLREAGVTK